MFGCRHPGRYGHSCRSSAISRSAPHDSLNSKLGSASARSPVVVLMPKQLLQGTVVTSSTASSGQRDRHQPGEVQRWQILKTNENAIVRLPLEDVDFYVLANDGVPLRDITPEHKLLLGPGVRREVLVQGGPEGNYRLESLRSSSSRAEGSLGPDHHDRDAGVERAQGRRRAAEGGAGQDRGPARRDGRPAPRPRLHRAEEHGAGRLRLPDQRQGNSIQTAWTR